MEEQKTHSGKGCTIFIAIIFIIGIIITPLFLIKRNITTNDLILDESYSLTSYNLTLTPKCNIDDLKITIEFYDDKKNIIKTIEKNLWAVKKGQQYEIEISLFEFNLTQILTTERVKIIPKGKASLLSGLF